MNFSLKQVLVALVSLTIVQGRVIETDPEAKFVQCGGTVESDRGFLSYPENDEPHLPGEICIWTIHLKMTGDFRFNFSFFNLTSEDNDKCQHSGVRIYSLTNLIASPEPQVYTFCDEIPPPEAFYVGNPVVAVLYYSDQTNSGFTLNWEGVSFDNTGTKHYSSLMRTPSGPIQYPIIGNYESNLAATWLIKADDTAAVDISIQNLMLQSCPFDNPCYCDSLFIYEVTTGDEASGPYLQHTNRLCTNITNPLIIPHVNSKFIIALFTDREPDEDNSAPGRFSLIYYPSGTSPTTTPTTTTEEVTTVPTTSEEPLPELTECGTKVEASAGRIVYKLGTPYQEERCMFTVRARDSGAITFRLVESGIPTSDRYDFVHVSTFTNYVDRNQPGDEGMHFKGRLQAAGSEVTLTGSVAVILFGTSGSGGTGFVLEWEGDGRGNTVSRSSTDYMLDMTGGTLRFPPGENARYSDYEVSTFVFQPPGGSFPSRYMNLGITANDGGAFEGNCYDTLRLFYFGPYYTDGFTQYFRLCNEDLSTPVLDNSHLVVIGVFVSDYSNVRYGVTFDWDTDIRNCQSLQNKTVGIETEK